jgi:hypothetical protein
MTLETDLNTLSEYHEQYGQMCCPPQDVTANYTKSIRSLASKKPTEAKIYYRYVVDKDANELVMDCTFKVSGMFFGFFTIRRCEGTTKWSKNGRYYLTAMHGCGMRDYDTGAITGLDQAKALAALNTRLLLAALHNVTLK